MVSSEGTLERLREHFIVCTSNNCVHLFYCRSSSDDSANASRKRKKADPRFSGIGFASSDEERINRERDKGRRVSAVGAAGGDGKKVTRVTSQKKKS